MTLTSANAVDGQTVEPGPRLAVSAELLDVKAVALLLGGCSTRHIYRLADAGRMPGPIRLGTLVRWRRAEVMSWIDDGCQPVRPSKPTTR
ncbi:MAG: helix-turn-helix domain-containing protein [Phycisphaerales bacterium]|nr:MAG: helix-turn-helix domain-containing protein [Phycisphaerales bacterium]